VISYTVEVVLRERDYAVTEEIRTASAPREWTELEVEDVLRDILRAIDRAKNPEEAADRQIALRGFSWIVEPSDGGVVIAVEIPMGAAVAGPFDADPQQLDALITRALQRQAGAPGVPPSTMIH
jgi:hypothetical protein